MQTPCLERIGPLRLVGLMRRQNSTLDAEDSAHQLILQWCDYIAQRPEPASMKDCLGVHLHMADGETRFDYFSGASSAFSTPAGFVELRLPAMLCATFSYQGHAAGLRKFVQAVFASKLPSAGLLLMPDDAETPEFIERFDENFDPETNSGGMEILIPVQE